MMLNPRERQTNIPGRYCIKGEEVLLHDGRIISISFIGTGICKEKCSSVQAHIAVREELQHVDCGRP
jgi:hypothetical protein